MEAKKGRREMKKFELTTESITNMLGKKLFRIKALVAFGEVKAGELGGYVEKEENVSQYGDAWVFGNAEVFDDAWVYENAKVYGNARVSNNARVFGRAKVYGNAWVFDNTKVYGKARVCGNARVYGNSRILDEARVFDDAKTFGNAWFSDKARVYGNARVSNEARVFGSAEVYGNARVFGNAKIYGKAKISKNADYALIQGFGIEFRCTTFYRDKDKKIMVDCGCFCGDLEAFRKQVKETRSGKIAKEYLMIADLMEYHFTNEDSGDE